MTSSFQAFLQEKIAQIKVHREKYGWSYYVGVGLIAFVALFISHTIASFASNQAVRFADFVITDIQMIALFVGNLVIKGANYVRNNWFWVLWWWLLLTTYGGQVRRFNNGKSFWTFSYCCSLIMFVFIGLSFKVAPLIYNGLNEVATEIASDPQLYKNNLSEDLKEINKQIDNKTISKFTKKTTDYLDSIQSVKANGKEKILVPNPLYGQESNDGKSNANSHPYLVFEKD